jgi:hypothetical protein
MSDGTDDKNTRVSGSLGTLGVDRDRDGDRGDAGSAAGDRAGVPSLSYAMMRCDGGNDIYSLYDIVERVPGRSARIMATRVRYQCAVEITHALNSLHRE